MSHRPTAVEREYALLAAGYDRTWRRYLAAALALTLPALRLSGGPRVLDVGCGTGLLLRAIAARAPAARLTGVDRTAAMLRIARAHDAPGRPIHWLQGDATALPIADASIDLLVSTSMLHYLRDTPTVLREWRRVLRPGGQLVITDWCGDALAMRALDRLLRVVDPAHHRVRRADALAAHLRAAGLGPVHITRGGAGGLWRLMTLAADRPLEGAPSGLVAPAAT
jgi:ubiquinone/menaquinone biosynthesis C-methylase UbiE